jgi:hypothetical protein
MKKSYTTLALTLTIITAIFMVSCGSGKFNKDPRLHQQFIEKSRSLQGVTVSLDTVFFKGEHYCILKEEGISFSPFYTFYSLTGEKAIYILPYSAKAETTTHHEYNFFGTMEGSKAYDDYSFSTVSVIETVINNNLLSPTGLRPIDVGNFCKDHPRPSKFNPASMKVTRNLALEVKINQGYGEIYQGKPLIGKFTQTLDKQMSASDAKAIFKVKFVNGTDCATVKFLNDKREREKNKSLEVFTEHDGKMHFLTIEVNNLEWDVDAFKQAVVFLVQKGYL